MEIFDFYLGNFRFLEILFMEITFTLPLNMEEKYKKVDDL